jgi:hypothetical protein
VPAKFVNLRRKWTSQPQEAVTSNASLQLGDPIFLFNAAAGLLDLTQTWPLTSESGVDTGAYASGKGVSGGVIGYVLPASISTEKAFTISGVVQINAAVDENILIVQNGGTYFFEIRTTTARRLNFRIRNSSTNVRSSSPARVYELGEIARFCLAFRGSNDSSFYTDDGQTAINVSTVGWGVNDIISLNLGVAGAQQTIHMLAIHARKGVPPEAAAKVAKNPWQLFAPRITRIPLSAESRVITPAFTKPLVAPFLNVGKKTRTSQPQTAVGIDWSNPIARGLIFAAVGRPPVNLCDGRLLYGAIETAPYLQDLGPVGVRQSGLISPNNLAAGSPAFGISGGIPPDPSSFTFISFKTLASAGTYVSGGIGGGGWTASGSLGFFLGVRYSSALFYPIISGVGMEHAVSLKDNKEHMLGLSLGRGVGRAWKDGVQVRAATIATPTFAMSSSFEHFFVGNSPLTLLYSRELSAQEHASLQNNPWQLLAPNPASSHIWVPAP